MTAKTLFRCLALLISAFACRAPATAADKPTPAPPVLEGRWKVLSVEFDGKANADGDLRPGAILIITGNAYKWEAANFKEQGTVELQPSEKPAFITFIDSLNQDSEGIYKLAGNRLTLCYWAGERPKDFKSSPEALLVVLEREKTK